MAAERKPRSSSKKPAASDDASIIEAQAGAPADSASALAEPSPTSQQASQDQGGGGVGRAGPGGPSSTPGAPSGENTPAAPQTSIASYQSLLTELLEPLHDPEDNSPLLDAAASVEVLANQQVEVQEALLEASEILRIARSYPSSPLRPDGKRWDFFPDVCEPQPKQQTLMDKVWEGATTGTPEYLLWGGTAGPGKSWGLRWSAIVFLLRCYKYLHLTNVAVGLFTIDFPRLRDRHLQDMKRIPEWIGLYNETTHDFTLRPEFGSGVIRFRNLDEPAKYASAEFAALFIEELTELDRATFEEIRTRKRWPGIPFSPVVAVCNPRHRGLQWVRKLWIEHDFTGPQDAGLRDHPFWFLPAFPSDNAYLPPSYYKTLDSLGPILKKQLLDGNWYVSEDAAFPEFTRYGRNAVGDLLQPLQPYHVLPTSTNGEIPSSWRRIASHDWGYRSPGHHLWGAIDPAGGLIIYREWSFRGLDPQDIASGILFRQSSEAIETTYADPAIWQERRRSDLSQEQINTLAQAGKLQLSKADQYAEAGLSVQRANNQRIAGLQRIHTLLKDRGDGVPFLRILDCCPVLIACLQNIVMDPSRGGEDVLTDYLPTDDLRDDPYDALRYLLMGLPSIVLQWQQARSDAEARELTGEQIGILTLQRLQRAGLYGPTGSGVAPGGGGASWIW